MMPVSKAYSRGLTSSNSSVFSMPRGKPLRNSSPLNKLLRRALIHHPPHLPRRLQRLQLRAQLVVAVLIPGIDGDQRLARVGARQRALDQRVLGAALVQDVEDDADQDVAHPVEV